MDRYPLVREHRAMPDDHVVSARTQRLNQLPAVSDHILLMVLRLRQARRPHCQHETGNRGQAVFSLKAKSSHFSFMLLAA
jgi:hypothetical protein